MKILIAEDNVELRASIENFLQRWGYRHAAAGSGSEALALLRDDPEFTVLVADWMMPGIDGLELCRRARRLQRSHPLFIILTIQRNRTDLLECVKAGADVFLNKPYDPLELQAQILVADRIAHLHRRLATEQQEYEEQLSELNQAYQRMKDDMRAAAQIQKLLLPREPPATPGATFRWVFESSDEVAGDMFNVFRLDEKHIGFWALDAPNRGVTAAMLAVSISQALNPTPQAGGLVKRRIDEPPFYEITPPKHVVAELNRRYRELRNTEKLYAFFYGVLNIPKFTFTFCRAGEPGVAFLSEWSGGKIIENGFGPPLGVADEAEEFEETRMELAPGDRIVLYSDGVSDALSPEGVPFGPERTLASLQGAQGEGIAKAIRLLRDNVMTYSNGRIPPNDDMMIVGFEMQ